jgi:16S rRNA G966 N2-methylase RsmD
VDDFDWDCDEAKWLIGFIITGAPSQPKKTASKWKTIIRPNTQDYKLSTIASNLYKIRHWDIRHGSYVDIPNEHATWFIDPPYQFGGEHYRYGNKAIDFVKLSEWCISRNGESIICENSKADWMKFEPLVEMQGVKFRTSECMLHLKNPGNGQEI